jgi:geranylgeranylglycerol-phosphate geranylgeranyltransferase
LSLRLKGFIRLIRPTYWLMTGGLSILTALVLLKGDFILDVYAKIFVSMSLIASGGFAINDFFDEKADAVVKPSRPIPSGAISPVQAIIISALLFSIGLLVALMLNTLCLAILLVDTIFLIFYSAVLKRHSGFLSNTLVGALIGTSFLFGEAAISNIVSIKSLSLSLSSFGSIGGNVLRDVMSSEGDAKVGYPTLPQKLGISSSAKIGAFFFLLSVISSPLPYIVGVVNFSYLFPIIVWDCVLMYSTLSIFRNPDFSNVKKLERIVTMTMILIPIALVLGAYT